VLVPRTPDAVFAAAREHFSPREIVEIHMVVGAYWSVARMMTNLDLELDAPEA
jgi:alkylhydroperoxidase family enzyme